MKKTTLLFAFLAMYCLALKATFGQNTFPGTGNVGIGTTAPNELLEVRNGDARINDLTIGKGNNNVYGNTAIGRLVLGAVTTGGSNTAVGNVAMYYNTTGYSNTAVGGATLRANTSGFYNAAVGYGALNNNTSGSNNTSFGAYALFQSTSTSYNTAVGAFSFYNLQGYYNTALGYYAGYGVVGGAYNTVIGYKSLMAGSASSSNTALGYTTLMSTTSDGSTAIGTSALYSNTTGGYNTGTGFYALESNTTGAFNASLGCMALDFNETGNFNTAVGANADVTLNNLNNATAVGYSAVVDASNKVRIGNSSVSSNGGQVNWTAYSDARVKKDIQENVPGLEFINALRPVTYHYDVEKENALLGIKDTSNWDGKYAIEQMAFTGFLAQDVQAAADAIDYDFSGVDKSGKILGLRYAEFTVPLVKAVQELSTENSDLRSTIDQLQAENMVLNERLDRIEAMLNGEASSVSIGASASLAQNVPNPFSGKTQIAYYIPDHVTDAKLMICNLQGVELFSARAESGNGSCTFDGSGLAAGTYVCSLWINGVQVKSIFLQITG
ncbi:MAG: tail fiber domain-containing protein [Chitinophagales bacterium]